MSPLWQYSLSSELDGPFLTGFWTLDRISWVTLFCLAPPLAVTFWETGSTILPIIALSLILVIVCQAIFAARRNRSQRHHVLVYVLVFSLIVGGDFPLWPAALGLSFGLVVGELVFGGRGFSFVNPVAVALVFLTFSFPAVTFSDPGAWLSLASLPSAVFLLYSRLISWRMLSGFFLGLIATGYYLQTGFDVSGLFQGSLLFVTVFLACDPVSSAATNIGRWLNGLLSGALVWVFSPGDAVGIAIQPLVAAVFLGSIFAPLIDR
ncbi:MAG: RnfABCDGE type electron transport complex subunit D, partial [Rhodobacteraceae bacterium]|nr:RnfABCDGE type electron transport complex subunit D [Paracoccaceae bacterium]